MDFPEDLKYLASHEWLRKDGDSYVVGITEFAQDQLGDVVFVELPEPGTRFEAGATAAVVESVKTASDIYAPLAGNVTEVNDALTDSPELINDDPYGAGWLFRIEPDGAVNESGFLDAAGYRQSTEDEG